MLRSARARAVVCTLGVMALLTAACSSGTSSSSTGGASGANSALLGPVNQASGPAITIGYIDEGVSAAIDSRPEVAAAQAAVKYINGHLGGVAGRPLQLLTCGTN